MVRCCELNVPISHRIVFGAGGAGRPKETRARVESNSDLICDFRHGVISDDDRVIVGR